MSSTLLNRGRHYNDADASLKVPLTGGPPHSSSFSTQSTTPLLNAPSTGRLSQQQIQAPQSIHWSHQNRTTFTQIAYGEPIDPNVIVIPKHPTYLSPLYRPNSRSVASEEGFATLRVESLALCCLFVVTAAIFSPNYIPIIILCTVACVLCVVGFIGALRQIKPLVYLFWFGLFIWVLSIITIAFTVLFVTDSMKDDATGRCHISKDYFLKFNKTPYGTIDCGMNSYLCFKNCVSSLQQHLRIAYFVFGGLIVIFLSVYFFRANILRKVLIWPKHNDKRGKDGNNNQNDENSEEFDEDDDNNNSNGPQVNATSLQQQPLGGVYQNNPPNNRPNNQLKIVPQNTPIIATTTTTTTAGQNNNYNNITNNVNNKSQGIQLTSNAVQFSSKMDGDDILITTNNPLNQ
jgi:hypothetical protein